MATQGAGSAREGGPRVGIVGGGLAGLTAALRLAERGYKVTVYEQHGFVGGLYGSHTHGDGIFHEHSFHMLLNWYNNFWALVDDIGLSREGDFEPRSVTRYMRKGQRSTTALTNPGSPFHVLDNLFSGVAPPADMFLWAYTLIDLLTQNFRSDRLLDRYSVNSFAQSRPYASERSSMLLQYMLTRAFAVPSYMTSAASFQSFVKYGFRDPDPSLWVLKGDTEQAFWRPFKRRLDELKCAIKLNCRVTELPASHFSGGHSDYRVTAIKYEELEESDAAECWYDFPKGGGKPRRVGKESPAVRRCDKDPVDYVIAAIPPRSLAWLLFPESISRGSKWPMPTDNTPIQTSMLLDGGIGAPHGATFGLTFAPLLKLKTEPMAALDVAFTRKLDGIPREHVVLLESEYGLSFIDNSQLWPGGGNTVLNVIASDLRSLATLRPEFAVGCILAELSDYIPLTLGDVDWPRLHFQTNIGDGLFINEVGSENYRPGPHTRVPNLFLAGDFCKTAADAVTLEGAVMSGLQAVRALQAQAERDGWFAPGDARSRVDIVEPQVYPQAHIAMLKTMLAPYAAAAKSWSWFQEQAETAGADRQGIADLFRAWNGLLSMPYEATAAWERLGWDAWRAWLGLLGRGPR